MLGIALGYIVKPVRNGRGYRKVVCATREEAQREIERLKKKTGKAWHMVVNML